MYLGNIYNSAEFRLDRTSNMAAILENQQSAIAPELMAGSSPNFIIGTSNKDT
jgi:hypothetical protein